MTAAPPAFEWLAHVRVDVGEPQDLGSDISGGRRVVPIRGGEVTGSWTGRILAGGADWQTVLEDGSVRIDALYPVHLDGVGPVLFRVRGARPSNAATDTFCTTLLVDGAAGSAIGRAAYATVGSKVPGRIEYDVFEIR